MVLHTVVDLSFQLLEFRNCGLYSHFILIVCGLAICAGCICFCNNGFLLILTCLLVVCLLQINPCNQTTHATSTTHSTTHLVLLRYCILLIVSSLAVWLGNCICSRTSSSWWQHHRRSVDQVLQPGSQFSVNRQTINIQ